MTDNQPPDAAGATSTQNGVGRRPHFARWVIWIIVAAVTVWVFVDLMIQH